MATGPAGRTNGHHRDHADRGPRPDPLLELDGLTTGFAVGSAGEALAVEDVSFRVGPGETLGVVGESGSGKSLTMLSILGLLPRGARVVRGTARFRGEDLTGLGRRALAGLRGNEIAMIFQDPMASLNPVFRVGRQIGEPLRVHRGMSSRQARARAVELLDAVGIPDAAARADQYPHEYSGGMRQRAMIAMALACEPALLIADEPTTALDVTVQAQILDLLQELQRSSGMAMILVTHDLGVAAGTADEVAVMYAGRVVESGPVREVFRTPVHPYTSGLLASVPRADRSRDRLDTIPGRPADLRSRPSGCAFRTRCAIHEPRCAEDVPPLGAPAGGLHASACWVRRPQAVASASAGHGSDG